MHRFVREPPGARVTLKQLDRFAQRAHALEASGRIARQRHAADVGKLVRHVGVEAPRRRFVGGAQQRSDARAGVRRPVGDDEVQDAAEQVHVGAHIERLARQRHLRRHVLRCAGDGRERGDVRHTGQTRVAHAHRDAPIEHIDLAERADHHVFRLQIAMKDAAAVREFDGTADFDEGLQVRGELVLRRRTRAQHVDPRAALDALHREQHFPVRTAPEGIDRHDVRMLEQARDAGLAQQRQRIFVAVSCARRPRASPLLRARARLVARERSGPCHRRRCARRA
jgi:hypothetical protein